ncbi:uncharacterized [Tachysurus ichikawai]
MKDRSEVLQALLQSVVVVMKQVKDDTPHMAAADLRDPACYSKLSDMVIIDDFCSHVFHNVSQSSFTFLHYAVLLFTVTCLPVSSEEELQCTLARGGWRAVAELLSCTRPHAAS